MARTTHTITFATCGHTTRDHVAWSGGATQRDNKIAWVAANLPCPDCRDKARTARDTDRLAATATSDLTGTPRQIAWATDLRNTALTDTDRLATRARGPELATLVSNIKTALATHTPKQHGGSPTATRRGIQPSPTPSSHSPPAANSRPPKPSSKNSRTTSDTA